MTRGNSQQKTFSIVSFSTNILQKLNQKYIHYRHKTEILISIFCNHRICVATYKEHFFSITFTPTNQPLVQGNKQASVRELTSLLHASWSRLLAIQWHARQCKKTECTHISLQLSVFKTACHICKSVYKTSFSNPTHVNLFINAFSFTPIIPCSL